MPDILPTIDNEPAQGIQALLDTVYLWNQDVANDLIDKINELIKELDDIVTSGEIKPYSELLAPVRQYIPMFYGNGIYVAAEEVETLPTEPDLSKWILIATKDSTLVAGDGIDIENDVVSVEQSVLQGAAAGATAVQPGDLAQVATTGNYNDLNNKPSLGTAAAANVSDFATAAQGAKADTAVQPGDLATVATSGSYNDLTNKPTIPAAQVNSDWNANSGVAQILNKPTLGTMAAENANDYTKTANLATVATSGSYNDLSNKPTIPAAQVNSDWNANSGVAQILNKPTLGTAAAADTTDFATAAQGTKADTAAQPGDVSSAISTHNTAADAHNNIISPITTSISGIEEKIPAQASSSNQLADKEFVNSSIATNTANFIGTFNSVAELEAYSGPVTNNDYAYVIRTDATGNTLYDRYKYTDATTPASWEYEYTLNNSSFTADQWAAINSHATAASIGQISTNQQDISGIQTTIGSFGDIVTHDTNEFATASQGAKADTAVQPGDLATVATSGSYTDLSNTPTLGTMAAESASDYTPTASLAAVALSGAYSDLSGTPSLATVATSGSYNDLIDKPILGTMASETAADYYTKTAADAAFATAAQGAKADTAVQPADLATVATSGSYNDLSNKPTPVQYSVMPVASADNVDDIVQYTGTSTPNYTNGYFYKSTHSPQPESATIAQTVGTSLSNINVNLATFKAEEQPTGDETVTFNYKQGESTVTQTWESWNETGEPLQITISGNILPFLIAKGWSEADIMAAASDVEDFIVNIYQFDGHIEVAVDEEYFPQFSPNPIETTLEELGQYLTISGTFISDEGEDGWYDTIDVSQQEIGWYKNNTTFVRLYQYGIYYSGTPVIGDVLMVSYNTAKEYIWFQAEVQQGFPGTGGMEGRFLQVDQRGRIKWARGIEVIPGTMPQASSAYRDRVVQYMGTTDANYTHGHFYECNGNAWSQVNVLDAEDVNAVPQYSVMPTASVDNLGNICQFVGTTDATYTNGYFYKSSVEYSDPTATISQTGGSGLTGLAVDVDMFIEAEQPTQDETVNFVCGGVSYDITPSVYDGDVLVEITFPNTFMIKAHQQLIDQGKSWEPVKCSIHITTTDGNIDSYQISLFDEQGDYCSEVYTSGIGSWGISFTGRGQTVDEWTIEQAIISRTSLWTKNSESVNLVDYGVSYSGTPTDGDILTVAYTAPTLVGYYWNQVNVQPGSGSGSAPTLTWYTVSSAGTTITIADTSSANLVKVYKNGLLLQPTEDYTISGTTLTTVGALVVGDKITTEVF